MSAPPRTVLQVSPEEEAAIRAAVRSAGGPAMIIAGPEHVAGLLAVRHRAFDAALMLGAGSAMIVLGWVVPGVYVG